MPVRQWPATSVKQRCSKSILWGCSVSLWWFFLWPQHTRKKQRELGTTCASISAN